MKLLAELTQPNGTSLQVVLLPSAVYVSESVFEGGGEIVAGEGVMLDASSIDAIIAALQSAKRELGLVLDAAAE
jgi:hypothetical protein